MATVQKLREGVFLILWNVGNGQGTYYNQRQQTSQTLSVDIKEISHSCELTCIQSTAYNNNNNVFQLIIKRNVDPVNSTAVQSAVSWRDSAKIRTQQRLDHMDVFGQLNVRKSQGHASLNITKTLPKHQTAISLNGPQQKTKNLVPEVLEPSSVLVIVNGTSHVMELKDSTWNTEFIKTSSCGCGRSQLTFNVLIDFNSTSMKTETKQVMEHLLNLWETKTLADVTFKFKEKEVKAHTLIVASGSPVLAAMFQNDFKEKQERVVVIKDSNSVVFEKMLHFFYTGNPGLDNENVSDLLVVANKYGVDSLKEKCALFMAKNLTVDNVIRYLVVAHLHESPNLYKSALEFISKNSEEIVTKKDWVFLMKNYHELSLAAVQMMVLAKKETGSRIGNAEEEEEYTAYNTY